MNITVTRPSTFDDLITAHATTVADLVERPTADDTVDFIDHVRVASNIFYRSPNPLYDAASDQFEHAETYLRRAFGLQEWEDTARQRLMLALADGHLRRAFGLLA
ncbi:hypothetical protein EYS09_24835 [Streptomyces kasugaensis]|uniref:Uncharacterized protein n=1 Tax=Streptomyces kasugaensis TaxID=1946 RepID=A0A4Q9HS90_STRKA|nr:hypothetical protein [Streptomyces kasugaensis]TBO57030.1 hypothetical protein EYS09_24835 [Streptomyces kasugaensis]